ncbi:Si-specific NAD(P)(+) transhydrogenase [Alkalilimnicola sp. S0819]|uniref:Si-specific NAD(P)(+) transhydrogenase n=1 Tax=Alkalilimnicola sp. S0819 TaxID=2613922 RepID=UPI0012623E6C|nr:Si-specific NAD(P)(+) transhydrogenase [Alkalilimnicola sp. S0819]KAB7627502.1 Si-specific NAD(P)(+) transhydrogenase [Alkalilimnicola sp. S0819]MPQ15656.1 Si-specific NAD(P)(+) transhydrogenase [Alkalilimnicola sp. S0819]
MNNRHFDTLVIGSGPGGEGAAMKLSKAGRKVAMVELYRMVGGGCTHWGTIPSKALRHNVKRMMEFNSNPLYRDISEPKALTFPQLMRSTERVIGQQVERRSRYYARNSIPVLQGRARFIDAHTVELVQKDGRRQRYSADHFLIATGSRPYRPDDVDFEHPAVFDSDTILNLSHTPRSITIYGAGVIGSEYASIFRGLGAKVDLINTRERLLTFLDDEISDALSYHLRELGVLIRHNESHTRVEALDDGVVLQLESGKRVKNEVLLWAIGRTGNTQDMGLEALGIEPDGRGQLAVNACYQTAQPHIYAVGDVIGYPSLASAAYDQGRLAAGHILHGESDHRLVKDIPTGIYTIPEISSVGRTEQELTEAKVPYEVGHAFFQDLARAQITGQTTGMLKLLFHIDTLEILGIHCFGDQASEIVHIGQAIMSQPGEANNLMYFINTTFNYPTMAEAYRVAAINGYNRLS